ncbi:hypothetical protein [Prevotella pectinovora]|uniref:hypothetical protein n=1 Tax=Prevotella pectinovora TaxID=1602169 RepID=UPI0027DDF355|nr:hypothetical protein [uncultured Prevotella sp.]
MKKNLLYIALAFSMLINVAVLCVLLKGNISSTTKEEESPKEVSPFADYNKRQTAAENAVRRYVCENLYYPNSYDPVSTKVDSVFYNYLTDEDCVKAAFELIDLRKSYESAKDTYDENVNNIKVFGGSGVFRDHTINRDKAAAEMKDLKPKIEKREAIIKNRDSSMDGKFIGWQVIHRYRASNSNGVVSFGDVLYVLDPEMNQYYFRYSLEENDNKNLKTIKRVIEELLGTYVDD